MSYTQDDLNKIRAAKLALAAGERVGEFLHNNRRIRYSEVTLKELEAMETEVVRSLAPKQARFAVLTTGKGF